MKCASCGGTDTNIGEGTVFCLKCNAALGIVNKKVIEWDSNMVTFDGIVRQVFGGNEGPKGVSDPFQGEKLNHGIVLRGMDLQARVDELRLVMRNSNTLMELQRERISQLESENYRLREIAKDDEIRAKHEAARMNVMAHALRHIANSEDCGGQCAPLHDAARKALEGR